MNEKKQADLVREACKALGVPKDYVFAAKVYDDRVVVVTVGGTRASTTPGRRRSPCPTTRSPAVAPRGRALAPAVACLWNRPTPYAPSENRRIQSQIQT